jgi:hypothetical protein
MKRTGFQLTPAAAIVWCLLLAAAIEVFTCFLRFGLHLEAGRDTGFLCAVTCGLRIHHAYVGLAVIVLALLTARGPLLPWCVIVGAALVISDLVHHFLVLWPLTGRPEFEFFYPP